jgi:hypothetical protein
MHAIGIVLWIIATAVGIGWGAEVRRHVRTGQGIQQGTVNTAMLFLLSVILVAVLRLSPFHLLWMFPVALLLGLLSLAFPFSLLSIPGRFYGNLWCIGLDQAEVQRNTRRVRRYEELLVLERLQPEEAKERLRQEGLL